MFQHPEKRKGSYFHVYLEIRVILQIVVCVSVCACPCYVGKVSTF